MIIKTQIFKAQTFQPIFLHLSKAPVCNALVKMTPVSYVLGNLCANGYCLWVWL